MKKYVVEFLHSISVFILMIALSIIGMFFFPTLFHYQCFSVTSGSMTPKLPVGSLIYVKETPFPNYQEGDIITYLINNEKTTVTHRIMSIDDEKERVITKGDANSNQDKNPVEARNILGKVDFHIPYLGFLYVTLNQATGKGIWILLLTLFYILSEGTNRAIRKSRQLSSKKENECKRIV